jgi:hypothetical protein
MARLPQLKAELLAPELDPDPRLESPELEPASAGTAVPELPPQQRAIAAVHASTIANAQDIEALAIGIVLHPHQ